MTTPFHCPHCKFPSTLTSQIGTRRKYLCSGPFPHTFHTTETAIVTKLWPRSKYQFHALSYPGQTYLLKYPPNPPLNFPNLVRSSATQWSRANGITLSIEKKFDGLLITRIS